MSKNLQNNKFNFFVPLGSFEKANDSNGKYLMKIKGIASTNDEDSQNEILDCSGFDCTELLSRGMINWNHNAAKTSAAICGKPTDARVIRKGNINALELEGVIYNNTEGRAVAELIEVLQDEPDRQLGWSIEGRKVSTDPFNSKKITKAIITGVALTHCPINKNTFVSILKGEYADAFVDENEEKQCPKCVAKNMDEPMVDGKCAACGYTEKAMDTVNTAPCQPESVEHNKKDISNNFVSNNNSSNFGKDLKKSDIYLSIVQKYPASSIAEQKTIYSLVEQVNSKHVKMEGTQITSEALQKAFSLLDDATALVKGETTATVEATEIQKGEEDAEMDSEEVKKAGEMASFLMKSGMSKEDTCSTLTKGGFALNVAQSGCEAALAAMAAQQNGGDVSQVSAPIVKAEEVSALINTSLEPVNHSLSKVNEAIAKGFEGLNTIIKSLQEDKETLTQNFNNLQTQFERFASQPAGRKSIGGIAAIEKFQKSEDGKKDADTYNVASQEDLNKLTDRLFEENNLVIQKSGKSDPLLESAINSIEISKSVPQYAYQRLAAMGIKLQAPSRA